MRHRKSGRKLNRTRSHYRATLANLATALFEHKKIKTTTAKAKELRSVAERLITFAKKGDVSARRHVLRTIKNKEIVKILFDEIAPEFENRNGGYTRVIKLGQRQGDAAELSIIELIGFDGVKAKRSDKKKSVDQEKEKEAPATKPEAKEEKSEKEVAVTTEAGSEEIAEEKTE